MTASEILDFRFLFEDTFDVRSNEELLLVFWDGGAYRSTEFEICKEFNIAIANSNPTNIYGCTLCYRDSKDYEDVGWIERSLVNKGRVVTQEKAIETVAFEGVPCLIRELDGVCFGINLKGKKVCFRQKSEQVPPVTYWDCLVFDDRLPFGMQRVVK